MLTTNVILSQGGRILVPAKMRKALGVEVGDELLMRVENQELRIFNLQHAVKEAQELMEKYNPEKKCMSDDIIKDRRNEI